MSTRDVNLCANLNKKPKPKPKNQSQPLDSGNESFMYK